MKKLILLSVLSVLLYSAPGYTVSGEGEDELKAAIALSLEQVRERNKEIVQKQEAELKYYKELQAQEVQEQAVKPEEPAAPEVQEQAVKPEEPAAPEVQEQAVKPEEPAAPEVQEQAVKPEEPAAPEVQEQAVKPEEPAAPEVQEQAVKPEEPAAPEVQEQAVKPEEPAAPEVQEQAVKPEDIKIAQRFELSPRELEEVKKLRRPGGKYSKASNLVVQAREYATKPGWIYNGISKQESDSVLLSLNEMILKALDQGAGSAEDLESAIDQELKNAIAQQIAGGVKNMMVALQKGGLAKLFAQDLFTAVAEVQHNARAAAIDVSKLRLNTVPTQREPLVQGRGVSRRFESIKGDLGKLIEFSYLLGRGAVQYSDIGNIRGWSPIGKQFSAITGFDTPDANFGYLAYNESADILVVVFRGTQTSADWKTNAAARANAEGIHSGFAHKFDSGWPIMSKAIVDFYNSLPAEKKANLQIILTGHSQGAALAQIAGLRLGELFKKNGLDNLSTNQILVYAVSAPRAFQDNVFQKFNAAIGEPNAMRHNVKHDVVGNVGPGDWFGAIADRWAPASAQPYVHYKDIGHLAMQDTQETLAKGWANTQEELARRRREGENMMKRMKSMAELVVAPVEYAHMGRIGKPRGAPDVGFDPRMLETDFERMLRDGQAHMDAKRKPVTPEAAPPVKWGAPAD